MEASESEGMHFLQAAVAEVEVDQLREAHQGLGTHRRNGIGPQTQAHQVLAVFHSRGWHGGQSIAAQVEVNEVGQSPVNTN